MRKSKIKTTTGLSTRALLVSVNISQWTGRRLDKKATETANLAHKASSGAGSYHKKLLPGALELEAVHTIASQARKYFYEQTLPWLTDGSRIIAGQNYMPFAKTMREIKNKFDQAVREFSLAYPRLQSEALKQLGGLYDVSEYPDASEIESKFSIDVNYLPLPDVKDFRVEISENEKREFIKKMREVESAAMRDCWERIHKTVKSAAEKLADPKTIFRDSLLENISEIAELLPRLNISNDVNLEASRIEIQSLVSGLSCEKLRTNASDRADAAKKLAEIESRMGAFMGATK